MRFSPHRLANAWFILACCAILPLAAHAQMPAAQTVGGVTYVSGGIGSDEVAAMREQAPSYSAMFEFVEVEAGSQHGNWTADVSLDVISGKQTLATVALDGPILLLRLQPGRYTLQATHGDVKLTKVIEIKARGPLLRDRFIWRAAAGALGNDLRQ
jgi:hypothetical protein